MLPQSPTLLPTMARSQPPSECFAAPRAFWHPSLSFQASRRSYPSPSGLRLIRILQRVSPFTLPRVVAEQLKSLCDSMAGRWRTEPASPGSGCHAAIRVTAVGLFTVELDLISEKSAVSCLLPPALVADGDGPDTNPSLSHNKRHPNCQRATHQALEIAKVKGSPRIDRNRGCAT